MKLMNKTVSVMTMIKIHLSLGVKHFQNWKIFMLPSNYLQSYNGFNVFF